MMSGDEFYDDDVTSGITNPVAARVDAVRKERAAWPDPTDPEPSFGDLAEMAGEGGCDATDGCWVEPDGTCEHGHPSWLLRLGMI